MKFRFSGNLDCPEWLLSEIPTLSKISAMRIKMLCKQLSITEGAKTDYAKVRGHTKGLEGGEVKGR